MVIRLRRHGSSVAARDVGPTSVLDGGEIVSSARTRHISLRSESRSSPTVGNIGEWANVLSSRSGMPHAAGRHSFDQPEGPLRCAERAMFGCAEDQARFEELSAAHRTALEAEDIAALEKIQVELAELMKRRTLDLPPT